MNAEARRLALRLYERQAKNPDVFKRMGVEIKITKKEDDKNEGNS